MATKREVQYRIPHLYNGKNRTFWSSSWERDNKLRPNPESIRVPTEGTVDLTRKPDRSPGFAWASRRCAGRSTREFSGHTEPKRHAAHALQSIHHGNIGNGCLCIPSAVPVRFGHGTGWHFWGIGCSGTGECQRQSTVGYTLQRDSPSADEPDWPGCCQLHRRASSQEYDLAVRQL